MTFTAKLRNWNLLSLLRRRDDLCADAFERPDHFGHVLDGKPQPGGRLDRAGIVRERVNLDYHVTGPAREMDQPLAVLLLRQFDAEGLVEQPKLLDLAGFQDQKRQGNVGHESTSNVGRRPSMSRS